MDRAIRFIVLLAIVGGAIVAVWAFMQQPVRQPGDTRPAIQAGEANKPNPRQAPPRPEEKVGVTTDTIGGG